MKGECFIRIKQYNEGISMRTEKEMMDLIMNKAIEDDRIRVLTMDGSRANMNAVHDQYSDFDSIL
jgi:uncharacterized protein YggL (DUF469 family)